MTTMIERVARAMARRYNSFHFDRGDSDMGWEEHVDYARAAIAAMRDPTQQMEVAGNVELIKRPGARHTYTAMIDTALEEGE